MAKSITLLIPGLLDHLSEPVPRLPALETLLARAECRDDRTDGFEHRLLQLFTRQTAAESDVPEAVFCRLAHTGEAPQGYWICASPVHLFADQSQVYLHAIDDAALSSEEAAQLIAELNRTYAEDGWEFVQHSASRWYLRLAGEHVIRTTPVHEVSGRAIGAYLPQGDEALHWHRVLNEMQMLLHASPANQARQERGQLAINGVWLWGMGPLPEPADVCPWSAVWTELPLVRGMALLNDVPLYDVPVDALRWFDESSEGAGLVVLAPLTANSDAEVLQQLELNWFAPLLAALRKGHLHSVTLDSADGRRWHLSGPALKRFWKRRKPLSKYRKAD